jgi:hypothetical protein
MEPKTLRDNQRRAVDEIVSFFEGTRPVVRLSRGGTYKIPAQRCVIGFGGTGCGKTLIASTACCELKAKRVLNIVPPCGGVVFDQWMDELHGVGAGASSLLYKGDKRKAQLAAWRSNCDADEDGTNTHFVVTSIATLYADTSKLLEERDAERNAKRPAAQVEAEEAAKKKGKKRWTDTDWAWAYRTAAGNLGKFDLVVIDEFQEFRNGSPPNDERKAVDTTKSFYAVLDAVAAYSHPLVLGLSATPIVNSSGEIYSLMRLALPPGMHEQDAKLAIMEKTRRNPDPAVNRRFKEESKRIRSHIIVAIEAPPVPATTYQDVPHGYSDPEKEILFADYGNLAELATQFLNALIAFLEAPENPMRRIKKDILKNRFLSALTHSKRLTISPHSFNIPRARAPNPYLDPALDATGNVIMTTNEEGDEVPLGRLLPFDVAAAHAAVPLAKISKFSAVIDDLTKNTQRRSMIISEFTDVIELLALYLKAAFPDRQIFKFHGKVAGRDKQLAAFKQAAPDAILLATRGSMGMAVNVECTTEVGGKSQACVQYQLDLPMSQSAQQQTEGRTKRPIAQPGVEEWVVKKVLAETDYKTLEDWLEAVMKVKNSRCSDMLTDREEEATDGKQTQTDTDEGVDGPLKLLTEMLGQYAPKKEEKKRKRQEALLAKAKKGKA